MKEAQTPLGKLRQALVVDDDEDARLVLIHALQNKGFDLQMACGGREAVALLHKDLSLVLFDKSMPDGDGWMVPRELRDRFPGVAAILVSAATP